MESIGNLPLMEKIYLKMWMWLCEGKLKVKIAHCWRPRLRNARAYTPYYTTKTATCFVCSTEGGDGCLSACKNLVIYLRFHQNENLLRFSRRRRLDDVFTTSHMRKTLARENFTSARRRPCSLVPVRRRQYMDGWPNTNTPCCNNFFSLFSLPFPRRY